MLDAGRILIIPKGKWDGNTTYEMLDVVFHGYGAWLAKKPSIGIEPTDANEGYWFKMVDLKNATVDLNYDNRKSTLVSDKVGDAITELDGKLGGLKFVKLTEAEYEALEKKDANTIYFTT